MSIEHDNPFLEIGYTSPEQVSDIRASRDVKAAGTVVKKTVHLSHRRRRPAVSEEQTLANIDLEPTPLSAEERNHLQHITWVKREQNILAGLEADRLKARSIRDVQAAALARKEMEARAERWTKAGRGALQLMLPGMDDKHLGKPDK